MGKLLKYSIILVLISVILLSIINIYTKEMYNIVWLLLAILNVLNSLAIIKRNKKIKK